ncbi:MAG TPA: purine-nucleoside phosphorylase [Candidatus Kapabacteria bacterium]|nr:purine-nucleoside phosphorylase [Candidatus Kapabacteria bacterium]
MSDSQLSKIRRALGGKRADILVVLGSGMGHCFLPHEYDVLYEHGETGVVGHSGRLVLLRSSEGTVLVSLGRRHLYEGLAPGDVAASVRAAGELGVRAVLLTNASGGLNPRYRAGDIMLIEECIGMMMARQLHACGVRGELFATERYAAIASAALARGVALERGTYAAVPGPSYETRAEIRMLRRMGADAVGMSTLPEALEARRAGAKVIGISLITNTLSDTARTMLDHADVVAQGAAGIARMRTALDVTLAAVWA